MSASAVPPYPATEGPPPTLAARPFPRRVRMLLEGILEYASDELERGLTATLNDFEQQLFKLAEQARSNEVQGRFLETLRAVRRSRADVAPRYMIGLEAALASLKDGPAPPPVTPTGEPTRRFADLSLVEDHQMDESTVLREIASRSEVRSSLPLYLLGQRFGVLAGRPAFDAESLPIGPQSLCRILASASVGLEINHEHRMLLFRLFDRTVLASYASFVEAVNTYLARQGVLPHLQFVPTRASARGRPAGQGKRGGAPAEAEANAEAPKDDALAQATGGRTPGRTGAGPHLSAGPHMAGGHAGGAGGDSEEMFGVLRQLLAGRRQLLGKFDKGPAVAPEQMHVAPPETIQQTLGDLQQRALTPVLVDGKPSLRTVAHVKQDLLAQLRQQTPDGKVPAINEEDGDTIDLMGMLFDHLMKDVRPHTPAAALMAKLQVPLLRVALRDKGFFTEQEHPARQMLNTIAETGAFWLGDDEADRGLVDTMGMLVDRAVKDFDGDPKLFDSLAGDLSGHLQTVQRKAEVAERRHVEAARGKEKLALARLHAQETVQGMLASKRLPRFLSTLMGQAWTDVLALTSLRHGEDTPQWKEQIGIAERLISAAAAKPGSPECLAPDEADALRKRIETSLAQVGYHGDEASAIAQRLTAGQDAAGDDPASRTELAMKLKSRTRLGEEAAGTKKAAKVVPLDAREQACFEQLKQVPFGSWFEFTTNQQGDRVRRRLSWFSPVTGHALFVNHRGQRVGDFTLDGLARQMAKGQVKLVESERGTLIDRAWGAVVTALRSFAGRVPAAPADGAQPA